MNLLLEPLSHDFMVRALLVYKEVGYPYMIMPDHVPLHPDDPDHLQAFAFCYGYIRALIQAVDSGAVSCSAP